MSGELLNAMVALNPKRNVVFTAIDNLIMQDTIKKFLEEYRDDYISKGFTAETARSNVAYILGYMNYGTQQLWLQVMKEVFQ